MLPFEDKIKVCMIWSCKLRISLRVMKYEWDWINIYIYVDEISR